MNGNWGIIEDKIQKITGEKTQFISKESVSGGCINDCWKVTDSNNCHWFIKTNSPLLLDMFIAESHGLAEIAKSQSIRLPKSICYGETSEFSYLVLEYIPLVPLSNQRQAGEQLAQMHRTYAKQFGWKRDNTLGPTPQPNGYEDDWVTFWAKQRLIHQLDLAKAKAYPAKSYDAGLKLAENLQPFFSAYDVKPSLVHGDLWGGNIASDATGNTIIYDPAVYYGDRETDIALTELFGGFNQDFYAAYNDYYPLDQGYKTRKTLYNLYHILNHYNLLGGSYAAQALEMTNKLLAEIA